MTRMFYGLNDLGLQECSFYLQIAPNTDIEVPSFDHAWEVHYRRKMMHGLAFWLATIGLIKHQPETQPGTSASPASGGSPRR